MKPRYRNSRISSEVSRASQTQYAPHIGFPQSEPVTSARKVKLAPRGAAARINEAATFMRHTSTSRPQKAMNIQVNIDIQADGTCTKMMR